MRFKQRQPIVFTGAEALFDERMLSVLPRTSAPAAATAARAGAARCTALQTSLYAESPDL